MSTQVQYRRGTEAQNNSFVGALAEITVDTTNKTLRVHDGATAGGSNIATVAYVDAQIGNIQANAITFGSTSMSIASSGANLVANVAGTVSMTVASGAVGIGTAPTDAQLTVAGNKSASSWTTSGIALRLTGATYTDSSTATSGTAASNHINAIGLSTLAATNGGVTTTNAASLYIAGPPTAGSNMTITNPYALQVASGKSGFGGDIVNLQSNGVGNIGSSSTYFNTVFAKATSAQYADLAERYTADAEYEPGTVISFGGAAEITISTVDHDVCVAGVISTDPAFIMNTGLSAKNTVTVALTGRVPCRVKGNIRKGDRLVASDTPGVAVALNNSKYQPGCIIGKALENYSESDPGVIEVVVGRV
jgi:hypothetical protein